MTARFLEELARVSSSLEFRSSACFALFGREHEVGAPSEALDPGSVLTARSRALLQSCLYELLHCRIDAAGAGAPAESATAAEKRAFADGLSRANAGTGPWSEGWTIEATLSDGRIVASRDGLKLWARTEEVRVDHGGAEPARTGSLKMPAEYRRLYPGYYVALGDREPSLSEPVVRLYWHLVPQGAEPFVRLVTAALNRSAVPFQLKVLDDPHSYRRADAAVLYLPRGGLPAAIPLLVGVYREVGPSCREVVSHYCLPVAPGVSIAEDPGDLRTSFGLHRSGRLAEVLASVEVAGASGLERARLAARGLVALGIDPEHCHLNPGSADFAFSLA